MPASNAPRDAGEEAGEREGPGLIDEDVGAARCGKPRIAPHQRPGASRRSAPVHFDDDEADQADDDDIEEPGDVGIGVERAIEQQARPAFHAAVPSRPSPPEGKLAAEMTD